VVRTSNAHRRPQARPIACAEALLVASVDAGDGTEIITLAVFAEAGSSPAGPPVQVGCCWRRDWPDMLAVGTSVFAYFRMIFCVDETH
jgi:hypothetical protein